MSRRSLQNRVHATTPLRFLQRLQLITEVEEHRAGFVPALEMGQEASAFERNAIPIVTEFLVNQDAESSKAIETDDIAMLAATDQPPAETGSDRNVSQTIPSESGGRTDSRRVPTTNRVEGDFDFGDVNVAHQDVTDKVESNLSVQSVTEIAAPALNLSTSQSSESIAQMPDTHWNSFQKDTPVDADGGSDVPLIHDALPEKAGLVLHDNRPLEAALRAESGVRTDSRRVPTTNRVEGDVDFSDVNVAHQDVTDKVESNLSVQPVMEIAAPALNLSTSQSSESIAQMPDTHWNSFQKDTPVDADAGTDVPLINDAAPEGAGLALHDDRPLEAALRENSAELPTPVSARASAAPVEINTPAFLREDRNLATAPSMEEDEASSSELPIHGRDGIPPSTPATDAAFFDVALEPAILPVINSDDESFVVPIRTVLNERETPALGREPVPRRGRIEELPHDRRTVDGKPKSTETAPAAVEELFSKRDGVDRSPAAWAARLARAFESPSDRNRLNLKNEEVAPENRGEISTTQERNVSPRASRKVEQSDSILRRDSPIVVPEATRRFLRPLIGMDPSAVPIHQGPAAAEITSMNAADGVSAGGTVALNPDQAAGTPEYLGLLAHELTHVARDRQPQFVPPIARNDSRSSFSGTFSEEAAEHLDEEALARRVEARVVMAAESEATSDSVRSFDNSSGQSSDLLDEDSTLEPPPLPSTETDRWGGLPAPWEPLPDWVMALPDLSAPANESINVVDNGLAAFGTQDRGLPLALAEEGRMLDDPAPSAVPAGKTETAKPIPPDLDLLARQVYATLRRRLEAERRRQPF